LTTFKPKRYLEISIAGQSLKLINNGQVCKTYRVSTARNGAGETMGSECTPTGWHRICAKIGEGLPLYSVFVGRRPTGEIYTSALADAYPHRDWILTRILWLRGLEPGKNLYKQVDSSWRYIYIHGAPDHRVRGDPASHGCIRMKNQDMLQLFNAVQAGDRVYIH